jgi:hypothetical protein
MCGREFVFAGQSVIKTMYVPWMQPEGDQPTNYKYLAMITAGNLLRLAPALEKLVRQADLGLRAGTSQTYSALVDRSIVRERITATLGGFFGILAVIIACLGPSA